MNALPLKLISSVKISLIHYMLRITYALVAIIAGVDKFFNALVDWSLYMGPVSLKYLGTVSITSFYLVGIAEILIGILVLVYPRIGGWVFAVWLAFISYDLITVGRFYDIAMRDLAMAVGSIALALS